MPWENIKFRILGMERKVFMVMVNCPLDGLEGIDIYFISFSFHFIQYYVQFQETIKIYAHYIQHLHAPCRTRQNNGKDI